MRCIDTPSSPPQDGEGVCCLAKVQLGPHPHLSTGGHHPTQLDCVLPKMKVDAVLLSSKHISSLPQFAK